jgi:chromosome segregation ATPase
MPPILDFSSAFPWAGSGFLAGLLVYWLARLLFGIDRRRSEEAQAAQLAVDDARHSASEMSAKAASLESEWARLTHEVGQLQPRAALVPQFERQLSEMKQAEASRQMQLSAAQKQIADLNDGNAAQIATLRQDVETHSGTAKYYESEFNRLHADYDEVNKAALAINTDLQRAKAGLDAATREANESVRLRSELASVKGELEQRRTAEAKLTGDQAQAASVNEAKLKTALEAAEADIVTLRADIDQRRKAENIHAEALAKLTTESEAKLKSAAAEYATAMTESRKNAEDVARLKTELAGKPAAAAADSAELARLKDEAAKLGAELESAKASVRAAAMEHHATKNDLAQVRSALEASSRLVAERHEEFEKMKARLAAMPADMDNYRRFKDALDAANRIAAGLPEKT